MDTGLGPTRHKLDVDAYYRMAEVGILGENDRVELIDGELIDMASIGVAYASILGRLTKALVMACGDRAIVYVQNPVRLDRFNEPQPYFAVLRPKPDAYATAHPGPADVLLLVELADSSLHFDQTVKRPLCACAGVPEVWIVDLERRTLHAYRAPADGQYGPARTHQAGETLASAASPDIQIRVGDVLG